MTPDIAVISPLVALDHRLTLIQTRILLAIYSFRDPNTNLIWPSREAICQRSGYQAKETVSRAITELTKLGWIKVVRKKGQTNKYSVEIPKILTGSVNNSSGDRTSHQGSDLFSHGGSDRSGHLEHTNEHTKKNPPVVPPTEKFDLPPEINTQAWEEFVQHRKDIRHPLKNGSLRTNARILAKLSHEDQQATVDLTISNNWRGLFPNKLTQGQRNGTHKSRFEQQGENLRRAAEQTEAQIRHLEDVREDETPLLDYPVSGW